MFLSALSLLSPGALVTASPLKPVKSCFFVCYSLDFMNISPIGFLDGCFDFLSLMYGTRYQIQNCHSSGRNWVVSLLLMICLCARVEVYDENVSQPFLSILCEYFLIHQMCRCCSASFWILLKGNCCMCCCWFVICERGWVQENSIWDHKSHIYLNCILKILSTDGHILS